MSNCISTKKVKRNHCSSDGEIFESTYVKAYTEFVQGLSLEEVVERASKAIGMDGKKEAHQNRRKKEELENFYQQVKTKISAIAESKTFAELLTIVEECRVKGIRELTEYDTALRIGTKLGIYPDYVYLHAGTKKGLEAILGKRVKAKYISIEELPEDFYTLVKKEKGSLLPHEVEDYLCAHPKIRNLKNKLEVEKKKNKKNPKK